MNAQASIYLASASPRRRELLAQMGLQFLPHPVNIDESVVPEEEAEAYVKRLAHEKAAEAYHQIAPGQDQDFYVIGSDTSVVLGSRIFGKPKDLEDFKAIMAVLSDRWHQVMTGVSVIRHQDQGSTPLQQTFVVKTGVKFRPLNEQLIEAYWRTGEPSDKAGGYGIQGLGALLVEKIDGSYSNVVGLPLCRLAEVLGRLGLDVWEYQSHRQNPTEVESELSK